MDQSSRISWTQAHLFKCGNLSPRWLRQDRARVLSKWSDLIEKSSSDLAGLICLESGKPEAEAKGEVKYAQSFIDVYAGMQSNGMVMPPQTNYHMLLVTKEVGARSSSRHKRGLLQLSPSRCEHAAAVPRLVEYTFSRVVNQARKQSPPPFKRAACPGCELWPMPYSWYGLVAFPALKYQRGLTSHSTSKPQHPAVMEMPTQLPSFKKKKKKNEIRQL